MRFTIIMRKFSGVQNRPIKTYNEKSTADFQFPSGFDWKWSITLPVQPENDKKYWKPFTTKADFNKEFFLSRWAHVKMPKSCKHKRFLAISRLSNFFVILGNDQKWSKVLHNTRFRQILLHDSTWYETGLQDTRRNSSKLITCPLY